MPGSDEVFSIDKQTKSLSIGGVPLRKVNDTSFDIINTGDFWLRFHVDYTDGAANPLTISTSENPNAKPVTKASLLEEKNEITIELPYGIHLIKEPEHFEALAEAPDKGSFGLRLLKDTAKNIFVSAAVFAKRDATNKGALKFNLSFNPIWKDEKSNVAFKLPISPGHGSYFITAELTLKMEVINGDLIHFETFETGAFSDLPKIVVDPQSWDLNPKANSTGVVSIADGQSFISNNILQEVGANKPGATIHQTELAVKTLDFTTGNGVSSQFKGITAGISGKLALGDEILDFTGALLSFDEQFDLKFDDNSKPDLKYTLQNDVFLFKKGQAITLHFKKGSRICLRLDPKNPFLAMEGAIKGSPPISAYLPGLEGKTDDASLAQAAESRFILDFDSDDGETKCRISRGGAEMTARARPTTINLGGADAAVRNVVLDEGALSINRGGYELEVKASGQLAYFRKATGSLRIRSSATTTGKPVSPGFLIQFEPVLEGTWEDPTASIVFINPHAIVGISFAGSKWTVVGKIGAELRLKAVKKWLGDAAEWLSDFFSRLSLKFDGLDLELLAKGELKNGGIQLNYQSGGDLDINLWEIFKFTIGDFSLIENGFSFSGGVSIDFGGGSGFSGSLPKLNVLLKDGVQIQASDEEPVKFKGKLVTPTGIRASMEFEREESEDRQELQGLGSLSVPGWADVLIVCGVGKRRVEKNQQVKTIGMFFLFVETDYPITVYPAVVLRYPGLGFGINKQMRGFGDLMKNGVKALASDPKGLPNPAAPSDWEDAGDYDSTDLSLVARTFLTVSQKGDGPFPYVADALVSLQFGKDFSIIFTSNLWLFTKISDARKQEFRERPVMKTIIAMYPRHGYLEAFSKTQRNSRMSAAPGALSKALSLYESEMYLKATPDMLRMRVGPTRTELKEIGFLLKGSLVYGIEAGSGVALMLMSLELQGGFEKNVEYGFRTGPLSVSAKLRLAAKMGLSVLLAGGYLGKSLGVGFYGYVRVHISVEFGLTVSLKFKLRIKIGWVKITISWSKRLSAHLSLSFDAQVEALAATSDLAFKGSGVLSFRAFGFTFSPRIAFSGGNTSALNRARSRLKPLLPKNHGLTLS